MNEFSFLALGLLLARLAAQWWLDRLNAQHTRARAADFNEAWPGNADPAAVARATDYTLAKLKLGQWERAGDFVLLVVILFSGLLPWAWRQFTGTFGDSAWASAAFLFACGLVLALPGLPFSWYTQFRLEERFGFNRSTGKLWVTDRLKGLLLALLLGVPLLALLLKLADWTGTWWWLGAGALVVLVQMAMTILAPRFILPLFNQLSPLPEGPLRNRLLALCRKTGFHSRNLLVMDGSRRSRHSNAFFTGFGRWRIIVLFDTLIQQLDESELEAVLAHEIGHYKQGHIPALLLLSTASTLVVFALLGWLGRQTWFFAAFGFPNPSLAVAMLLFALVGGAFSFWAAPLLNAVSRRFEYQADAFAAQAVGGPGPLISALRRLHEKNLSNLAPHPLYSAFHYSHPTLQEREKAISSGRFGR